jgi:hypothetical protein
LCESCRSGVLIDQAVLYRWLEAFVELTRKSFIVPSNKPLDAAEVGEVGGDGEDLVQVAEFSLLGTHNVWVAEGAFQGFCVLMEGLELGGDLFGDVVDGSGVLIQERLKPVVCGPIEVTGGKENLLVFGWEEFGAAQEVMAALGEVQIQLVSVSGVHLGGRHLGAPHRRKGCRDNWSWGYRYRDGRLGCDRGSGGLGKRKAVQSLAHSLHHSL